MQSAHMMEHSESNALQFRIERLGGIAMYFATGIFTSAMSHNVMTGEFLAELNVNV